MESPVTILQLENVTHVRMLLRITAAEHQEYEFELEPGEKRPLADGIQFSTDGRPLRMKVACSYKPEPAEQEVVELRHAPHAVYEGITLFFIRNVIEGQEFGDFRRVEAFPVSTPNQVRLMLYHNCDGVVIVGTADL